MREPMPTITLPAATTRWSSQRLEDRFEVDNPATGAVITTVQGGGAAEVDSAVRTAHAAFEGPWRQRSARERGELLHAVARKLREHADELAALECLENGKPLLQARFADIEACIGSFDYFGALIGKLPGTTVALGPIDSVEHLEPFGVVGGIIPFNWPPIHFAAKTAPALAVGNTVVLKPGEQAPLTVMRLVELANQVLPPDVLHVVPGRGDAGAALAGHPLVRKLSFTGAPATGVQVLQTAAANLTPTLMELGGKNPFIVFDDAKLEDALCWAIDGAFFNKGEACTAASRLIVQRGIYPRFVAALAEAVPRLRVGDGMDRATHVGPVVSAAQRRRVLDYIALGQAEGARLLAQAPLPTDPRLAGGHWVPPTVFAEVRPSMRIAREEIFGPVTCVLPFDTEDEAIAIANGTDFGLVSAVFSGDAERTARVSRRLEAGLVFVNNYDRRFLGSPFGGIKASGYGREHCPQTLHEFGYTKAVRSPSGRAPLPVWPPASEVLFPAPPVSP
jgi:acyl-CoA reductase-like NAD-dependent aldehyde dehydrogenase